MRKYIYYLLFIQSLLLIACNTNNRSISSNNVTKEAFQPDNDTTMVMPVDTTDVLPNDTSNQSKKEVINTDSCKQLQCPIWAQIVLSQQTMYLYVDGALLDTFKVTTGNKKHVTPYMERRPSGPLYVKYSSKKYPGGNYMGMGNMPYVVFVKGGYAIHGTTKGNIKLLGKKVSHGCIRLHPDNAKIFFDLVTARGINQTWISIVE
ncbi:MAG: L,D-transpeptidase [Bacteroidetes bacterium]|nr:L,D-transpeptidase [Bacteroidota bacterium]